MFQCVSNVIGNKSTVECGLSERNPKTWLSYSIPLSESLFQSFFYEWVCFCCFKYMLLGWNRIHRAWF